MSRVIRVGGALCVLAIGLLSGCTSHHDVTLTRPPVSGNGPIISATPKSGPATSTAPNGAEGASTVAAAPCPLASDGTVAGAFGGRIGSKSLSTTGKTSQCRFDLASSNLGPGLTVFLSRSSSVSAATFAAAKQSALAHGAESIGGVGSDAYYTPSAHSLQYRSGSDGGAFGVTSTNPSILNSLGGQVRSDLLALAKAAIAAQ